MGSGIDGDEHFKCSTWKVEFYANFHPIHVFFGWDSLNAPKIGKRKNKVTSINLRGCKTQKNAKGGYVTDKTGPTIFVFINAMIFVFRTFVKNTLSYGKYAFEV